MAFREKILHSLALLLCLGSAGVGQAADAVSEYRVRAGDKLQISVWKEAEMQKEIVVTPDGRIAFPLTGELMAAGRSVTEIRVEIESRLRKYIPEPAVSVTVSAVGGNVAYVIGQVNRPGLVVMNPAINVLQALSIAGGGTPFAKLDSVIIVRGSGADQKTLPFRYSQVAEGKRLDQNVQLEAGDVVIVP